MEEGQKLCLCRKIKSNTLSRQNLSDIRGTFILADVATKLCLEWGVGGTELLHSLWNTLKHVANRVNVILLVKSATHFFLSSTWDLKTERAVSVLIDMASLTRGFDSIMWAPWQSGGRWRNQAKEYHMYFPKAAQRSPNGSTWFNAVSFHDLQVLKENYHIIAFQHAQFPKIQLKAFPVWLSLVLWFGQNTSKACFVFCLLQVFIYIMYIYIYISISPLLFCIRLRPAACPFHSVIHCNKNYKQQITRFHYLKQTLKHIEQTSQKTSYCHPLTVSCPLVHEDAVTKKSENYTQCVDMDFTGAAFVCFFVRTFVFSVKV